jgi:hypothetical protein
MTSMNRSALMQKEVLRESRIKVNMEESSPLTEKYENFLSKMRSESCLINLIIS